MKIFHKKSFGIFTILIILISAFLIYQMRTTYHAHDTFDGYCKRRGLVVISQQADFGYCKSIATNKQYKIVLFKGRRFLDGDLPCGFLCF
ncbi:MAG: hypothetical protein NTX91_01505 [candidate division SR1 bacterium]|nr:hypothetical protein [candidate division SR1 bacterium]